MRGGSRGRGRGSSAQFRGRGGGGGRGRGGGGRTRGRGRGGARGRGGGGIRDSREKNTIKDSPEPDAASSDGEEFAGLSNEESDESISESEEEEEEAAVKPYNLLLQSLASSKSTDDQRNAKRRKIEKEPINLVEDVTGSDIDAIDEPGEEIDADEESADAEPEEDEEDVSDPFVTHFANPTPDYLRGIEAASKSQWQNKRLSYPGVGKIVFSTPEGVDIAPGKKVEGVKDMKLKQRLVSTFEEINSEFTPLQKALAPFMASYQDVLFSSRTLANAEELRRIYCLHALNHVFKTRDRVIKNNARLSKGENSEDLELRDQGFTRPKILFILPTRNACVEVVDSIIAISDSDQQENKKRFQDAYSIPTDEERIGEHKPEDFRALFGGNHDDMFRIGVKFTRKTIKFFSQFYNSDIILASPLGLRMAIGDESEKKRDYDFLSSIEIVVVDQADALLMQNWEHLEHVFKHLNLIPKDPHGCDFGRVRNWYLDSNAKYLRQTIMLSQFITPELNSLFTHHMHNIGGRVKTQTEHQGIISDLGLQIRQTFSRYPSPNPTADPDARFKFFKTAILPPLLRSTSTSTLIFIPSYFDFVCLRNHLNTLSIPFSAISEETPVPDVSRARSYFFTGRHSILLYTGRAHHFRRYELRGVTNVIFYSLPDNPVFYREVAGGFLVRSIGEGKVDAAQVAVRSLFGKWDVMKLERIVGSKRVRVMCNDVGDTFEFV